MGETSIRLKVHGPKGREELEALVDTGATFTKIPASTARKVGMKIRYEAEVELSDGRLMKRGLGLAEVEIEGVRRPVLVSVGDDEERPLVGYTTLELLGFKVNAVTRRLERTVAIEYFQHPFYESTG